MKNFQKIWQISRKLYKGRLRRFLTFFPRACLYRRYMSDVLDFFDESEFRRSLLEHNPVFMDVVPRNLYYAKSTPAERAAIIKYHVAFMEKALGREFFEATLFDSAPPLYTCDFDETQKLELKLGGTRKEGLFAVELRIGGNVIYHINAWINGSPSNPEIPALWIGALQGTNADNAQEIIKKCAKTLASYRPKNLILYATRAVARGLGCGKIYAVSNAGFYANNGIRIDRKLKTNLDEFWEETGGVKTEDFRFYEIPLVEARKSLEEMKPNKRSMYRKRFKILDEIDAKICNMTTNKHPPDPL